MDGLFWKQTFGDKSVMEALKDSDGRTYAMINYGPWDAWMTTVLSSADTAASLRDAVIIPRT